MRPSSARLLNSSVRISDLAFPASSLLVARTRAAFIHLDNLLSFAKADRDGRVDGYLVGYLPEEVVLLFFRKGEVISAGKIWEQGRRVLPVPDAIRRLRSEPERSELCYATASTEQLNWMYSACAGPTELRFVDVRQPEQLFPPLASEDFSGVLEFISQGRVNYLKFERGRFQRGYLCDRPPGGSVVRYVESLFELRADGTPPAIAGSIVTDLGDIPAQAPLAQVKAYRDLFRRISDAVEAELPEEGKRKNQRASVAVSASFPVFMVLAGSDPEEEPSVPVGADALTQSFADWTIRVLGEVELVSPGTAERLVRDSTREQRFVLQAAGYYDKLPWRINW
jgi:hypothetical protein